MAGVIVIVLYLLCKDMCYFYQTKYAKFYTFGNNFIQKNMLRSPQLLMLPFQQNMLSLYLLILIL